MKSQRNVGIAGCGYWGPNLIRNFNSLPNCTVKTACDLNPVRLEHMKRLYPDLKVTDSFESLVADREIDAVAIATPVWSHFDLARICLEAGKHVFIEKPMAATSAQCMKLNQLAAQKKLTLMVGHTYIYSSPVERIKQIIDSGDIGKLLYISSQRLNLGLFQKDINVAWDLAPHDISIIIHMIGGTPCAVNCQGKAHFNAGVEDVTNMSLSFDNGGFATIQSSWLDPNKVRRMTFVGTRRMILFDDNEPIEKIKIYDKCVEVPPHYDTFAEFQYSYHYGDMHCPFINHVEPLKTECRHFLDCIETGARPITSGYEGLQVVQILEAASESLRQNGARIDINCCSCAEPIQLGDHLPSLRKYA
jgi:predicted dehydrogenase